MTTQARIVDGKVICGDGCGQRIPVDVDTAYKYLFGFAFEYAFGFTANDFVKAVQHRIEVQH